MLFPETERVIYENNPLEQVICQLRFPTVLRIEAETPADFQERIRGHFPQYQEKSEFAAILPPELVQILSQDVIQSLKPSQKVYEFATNEGSLIVRLSSGFVSLTSGNYERWEQFFVGIQLALDALREVYSPDPYTRIGLRYRNLIQKDKLELEDAEWPELLGEDLIRDLATPGLGEAIEDIAYRILLTIDAGPAKVHIQHGYARHPETNQLIGYGIDSDFFVEGETDVDAAIDQLVEFNQYNRRLFRWCISDRLHNAMGPRPVGDY
ncbi:MAG: TIGR04255 family protein [Anaerolineaceae bacterium]|nr:TIGR04255 family protein [Anaerolineaceae bacterium]MCY4023355.1 TIGR04255 family protein [Anaerolineaceae bacterium]